MGTVSIAVSDRSGHFEAGWEFDESWSITGDDNVKVPDVIVNLRALVRRAEMFYGVPESKKSSRSIEEVLNDDSDD